MHFFCLIAATLATLNPDGPDSTTVRNISVIEGTLEQATSDDGASVLKDLLEHLVENPLDLNKATAEELALIPDVTIEDARLIVDLRKRVGKFTSVRQLEVIEGIGYRGYLALEPFVTVLASDRRGLVSRSRPVVELRSRIVRDILSLDQQQSRGPSLKSYARVIVAPAGNIEAGGLFEKDAGERFGDGFASGYVAIKNIAFLSRIVAGDFTFESGQGLVFWSPTSFSKGSDIIRAVRKSGSNAKPYRSTNEFSFLRGIALEVHQPVGFGQIELTAFGSSRHLAATISEENEVTSLYEEGLYRSDSEVRKRNQLKEELFGGAVHLRDENLWKIGASACAVRYDHLFASEGPFEFSGNRSSIVGVDGQAVLGRLSAFFEAAHSQSGGLAAIGGSVIRFSNEVYASMVYRDYAPSFHNLHAAGFGEYDGVNNERGFYFGIDASPAQWLRIRTYIDQFERPWKTSTIPFPSKGYDIFFQADVDVSSRLNLIGRFGTKRTASTETSMGEAKREIRTQDDRQQHRARVHATYHVSRQLSVAGRVEATFVSYGTVGRKESGHLIYQDVKYRDKSRLAALGRLIFFDTDSYDSRVYEYESEVRGASSIPPLYGRGIRYYLVLAYPLMSGFLLSGKFAETHVLKGERVVGQDRQASLQIDYSF